MASPAQVREHYDSLALIYRAFWGDHLHHGLFKEGNEGPEEAQVKLLEYCAGRVGVRRSSRVLDVGCGHGGTAIFLAQQYGCQVLGLTLSEKQAHLAREKATARRAVESAVVFAVGDAEQYDFGQGRYDLVWTMESSEHFQDKAAYLRRVARSLAPGGRLLLAAWTGSMQEQAVRDVARAFVCPSLQTCDEYQEQMQASGLQVLETADLTEKVLPTWEICHQRARKAAAVVPLLPRAVREFVEGIPVILNAYRSGALRYSVITAAR
jgi:tocopherol O-methyltransferase